MTNQAVQVPKFPTVEPGVWTAFSFSTSGDQTVVAADANNGFRILFIVLGCASQVNLTLKANGVSISGAIPTSGMALDLDTKPIAVPAGGSFVINSSANVVVGGMVLVDKE